MNKKSIVDALLLTTAAALLRLFFFNGLYGHDDWAYLFYVRSYLNNDTHSGLLTALQGLRYLYWYPIVMSFSLFGVSYWAAFVPGFLFGLATIPLTYYLALRLTASRLTAIFCSVVLILNPIDWMVSTTIRGDIEMSFYGGALFALLVLFRDAAGRKRLLLGVLTGIVWAMSGLTKEWGYVFAMGFFAVALYDMVQDKKIPWAYAMILLGFALVFCADTVFLRSLTGEWLWRSKYALSFWADIAKEGAWKNDLSTTFWFLPQLFAGMKTKVTSNGGFVNGYPYYGIFMWTLIISLPFSLFLKGPARLAAWFVFGILCWAQFGSMSWQSYIPYHKEPRYFTIVSVPAAFFTGCFFARLFALRNFAARAGVVAALLIVGLFSFKVIAADHRQYTSPRDFMPTLVQWLEEHGQARLFASPTIQNELDLRFGYRFADPVHHHKGEKGYGAVMDYAFFAQHKPDDYVLVQTDGLSFFNKNPLRANERRELVAELKGATATGRLYQVVNTTNRAVRKNLPKSAFLSDLEPETATQGTGTLMLDKNFYNKPIVLNGITYQKGLGTHARSEIVYDIDGMYQFFSSVAGMDDSGSIVFEVYADDQLRYQTPVMRSGDKAAEIKIPITGVKKLKLVVTDAGDGITCDHASWADARVY